MKQSDQSRIRKHFYVKYHLKRSFNKSLKAIHNFFYALGIDISLRKKEVHIDPVSFNSKDEVDKYYSSREKQIEITSGAHRKFFKEILKIINSKNIDLEDKNVADFGCGVGNLLYIINEEVSPATCNGFDFSDTILDLAKQNFPGGNFKKLDIYKLANEQFDFIFCTEVLEHLLYPDKALKNILSTVRNTGGGAFLSVPDGRKDSYSGHINFWSPESWNVFVKSQAGEGVQVETGYVTSNNLYAIILFNS